MKKNEGKYVYRHACAIILIMLATCMFAYTWIQFVKVNNQTGHLMGTGNIGMALIIYTILFAVYGCYLHAFKVGVERKATVLASVVLTAFTTDLTEVLLSMAITGQFRFFWKFMSRYALLFIAQTVVLSLLAVLMIDVYRKIFPPLQILEIYGEYKHGLHHKINALNYKYHVAELAHYSITEEDLKNKINKYDAVLINDIPAHEKNNVLKTCLELNKRVYLVPKISDIIVKSSEELNLFDTPLYLCRNTGMSTLEKIVKRFFDIVLSLIALIILSPVLIITGLAIKLEDHGPIFFTQERSTIGGKTFMILKFRSMVVDAEKDGRPHPAGEHDDRITKVGSIIRSTRIDELPQLINILKGDMSIVGPRPERVEHVEAYTAEIPEFVFRSKMKGGLTGYAQVYGKYNTTALDKLKMDLIYITNYSLLLDLQIIFETVKILFLKESTEGFTDEQARKLHGD